MSSSMLAMLRDEYLSAKEEKKEKRREIQERHRALAAEEARLMEDVIDKRLGDMLVRALNSGLKRAEIWKPVFGTNDNDRWRRLVELGGGETRAKRTGEEIKAEARAEFLANFRYQMEIVDFDQSTTGKGLLITTFEGEALPEPVTFKIMSRDNGTFFIMGSPDFPEWWDKMMRDGEYARFDTEVNEFLRREMNE